MSTDRTGSSDRLATLHSQSQQAYREGKGDRAIELADRLVAQSNHSDPAVIWAMQLRLEARRWAECVSLAASVAESSSSGTIAGLAGLACSAQALHADAERWLLTATRRDPKTAEWHYHRAASLIQLRQRFDAMECLKEAVELAPNPNGLLQLAELQLEFASPADAIATSGQASILDPSDPSGDAIAARSLLALGKVEEASQRWERALSHGKKRSEIVLLKCDALATSGYIADAESALLELIETEPGLVPAYAQLVRLRRMTDEDRPLVSAMERLASHDGCSTRDRILLSYALGKALEDLGEFQRAMERYDEANRLEYRIILDSGGFSSAGFAANLAIRKRVFSKESVSRSSLAGNPSELPIFVLGMIRSGTTLVEQILASHPQVSGAGEQEHWINADLGLIDYPGSALNEPRLRTEAERYLDVIASFSKGAQRVVDKQPGNLTLAGALHIAFPNARIVHMERDPADTALSIWATRMQTSAPFVHHKGHIVSALKEFRGLSAHWRQVIPEDRFMNVSYESLVTEPESVTRRIVEFCGLPWDPACLHPERTRKLVSTPSLWQTRQPIYRSSIGRWRNFEPWLGEFSELVG